jgi:hypothetical protein
VSRTGGSCCSRVVMRAIANASTGSVLPLPSWPCRSRDVIKVGTSTTATGWPECQHKARCTATARPKLPEPSIPTRYTRWAVNMSTSWAKPRSVFGTSPPATSRPLSSTTATARVSLWCLFRRSRRSPPVRCDRWAGDAQALWGGHTFVSPLAPSLYRASSPTITATGRQPLFRASPSLAGSIRSSRPGDVADPRTSQKQPEHPRVHQVCRP